VSQLIIMRDQRKATSTVSTNPGYNARLIIFAHASLLSMAIGPVCTSICATVAALRRAGRAHDAEVGRARRAADSHSPTYAAIADATRRRMCRSPSQTGQVEDPGQCKESRMKDSLRGPIVRAISGSARRIGLPLWKPIHCAHVRSGARMSESDIMT